MSGVRTKLLLHLLWIVPVAAVIQWCIAVAAAWLPLRSINSITNRIDSGRVTPTSYGTLYVAEFRAPFITTFEFRGFEHQKKFSEFDSGVVSRSQREIDAIEALPRACWDSDAAVVYSIRAGWPMRSISGEVGEGRRGKSSSLRMYAGAWSYVLIDWDFAMPRGVPMRIRPFSTIINTIIWSVPVIIVALSLRAFAVIVQASKAEWRFAHRRCVECNYEIALNTPAVVIICPECGNKFLDDSPLHRRCGPWLMHSRSPIVGAFIWASIAFGLAFIQMSFWPSALWSLGCALSYLCGLVRPRWILIPPVEILCGGVGFFLGICDAFPYPDASVTAAVIEIGVVYPIAFICGHWHCRVRERLRMFGTDAVARSES